MNRPAARRRWLGLLPAVGLLSACGFQPRGIARLPFQTLHIALPSGSELGGRLRRQLRAGTDVKLVDDPAQAQAIFQILSESRENAVLSLDAQGIVREVELRYRLSFRIHDGKGREFMPPTDISLRRDVAFNVSQQLASEAQQTVLYRDMQSDAVQQVVRQLAALGAR
jgi:LPS-assembly lipoprotein